MDIISVFTQLKALITSVQFTVQSYTQLWHSAHIMIFDRKYKYK